MDELFTVNSPKTGETQVKEGDKIVVEKEHSTKRWEIIGIIGSAQKDVYLRMVGARDSKVTNISQIRSFLKNNENVNIERNREIIA